MTIYAFDATVSSYDLLQTGVTEARLPGSPHRHHRVLVEADCRDDAALIAAQMVSCIPGFVCTGLYDRV